VLRLSEDSPTPYALWLADAPEAPKLALIDGQSYEARLQLESPGNSDVKVIWVGAPGPADVWRVFERPLSWPVVIKAMDELFVPPGATDPMDFELEIDSAFADTVPPEAEEPHKRALIASADRDERLYLRAKLALADLTRADDAETGNQALELVRTHQYAVALVGLPLPDVDGWAFLKELIAIKPAILHVVVTKSGASVGERIRAWFVGTEAFFDRPPDPGKLQDLLQKV
jgi:CheY-like chemotaxis protein